MITMLAFVAAILLLIAGPILHGYVLTILWAWFVVPTFGLPQISIAAAIGLALIVSFTRPKKWPKSDDSTWAKTLTRGALSTFLLPALFLLEGWIVQHWMPA